jgi:hypothetical protein
MSEWNRAYYSKSNLPPRMTLLEYKTARHPPDEAPELVYVKDNGWSSETYHEDGLYTVKDVYLHTLEDGEWYWRIVDNPRERLQPVRDELNQLCEQLIEAGQACRNREHELLTSHYKGTPHESCQ